MQINKLEWCFRVKDGIRLVEPNERLCKSYLKESKASLLRAHKNYIEDDFLWATVVLYYAEYYALYAFLQKIGVKCENHSCSILAVAYILGEEKTKAIEEHKLKRIEAQYYMKLGAKEKIEFMLMEAKKFVVDISNIISSLTDSEAKFYKNKLVKASKIRG